MSDIRDEARSLLEDFIEPARPAQRHSRAVPVRWGAREVMVGGGAPVRVQAMTNTDTVDAIGTAIQVKELALAGSEMVSGPGRIGSSLGVISAPSVPRCRS